MNLIFVYNADAGFINTLIDIGHKALSPDTYQCNLCGLTFGVVGEHRQWKQFREESRVEMKFLHRDEFEQEYNQKFDYPIVLQEDQELKIVISQADLENIATLDQLIETVKNITDKY